VRWRDRFAIATGLIAAGAVPVSPALANGDPASDVLFATDIYYPSSRPVPTASGRALDAIVREAKRRGRPIKVVLIASRTDLGTAASLFDYPDRYAGFLTTELDKYVTAPVLIVTPRGFGLGRGGRILSTAPLEQIDVTGADPDALARAAVEAVSKLTGLPAPKLEAGGSKDSSSETVVIVVAVVLALIAVGSAIALGRRRRRSLS
jgi:hypothetical protein